MIVNNLLRKQIVRQIARDENIPKEIVEDVIKHCFQGARKAFGTNRTVELSGFGIFHFKERQAIFKKQAHERKIAEMQQKIDNNESPRYKTFMQYRVNAIQNMIDNLNAKLNDSQNRLE